MGKLIDADVFDSILQDAQAKCKKNGGNFRFGVLNSVRANLANQPAVDAAPVVHGAWEVLGDCGITRCLACKWNFEGCIDYKYCPNCGARMDGETDG